MCPRLVVKLGGHVMLTLAAVACQQAPTLDEMPAGAGVTIQMEDGRHVTGKLLNVDPQTVVVSHERTAGKISVTRASIAEVQPALKPHLDVSNRARNLARDKRLAASW